MSKIIFRNEAKEKMLKGLDTVAEAVGGTLGPKGLNVIIERPYQPIITNDGATVAVSVELEDKFENLGAGIVRNVASQTNDDAGDGTTTTAVLLQAIVHECLKRPENPMAIRESLIKASEEAINLLKAKSRDVKPEDLEAVAYISSENQELAKMITDLLKKLGDKAIINIEDSKTFSSGIETTPGYDAPVGFLSAYFVNDPKVGKANFDDVHVLVSEKKLGSLTDLKPIAQIFDKQKIATCVFVVDDIDESILGVLVKNSLQGIFKSVVIKAHGEVLEDIAAATGANIISDKHGITWQNVKLNDLGTAKKVSVSAQKSLFLGTGVNGMVRATELEAQAENEDNEYRKKKLKDRASKLRGGVGVIRIGAATDYERDYLKLKAEDAVRAVQAALEEGIVEGGGMALWRVANELPSETIGEQILKRALTSPLKRIIENAGRDYSEITKEFKAYEGYDAKQNRILPLVQHGIIDPTKVEKCALQNAVSAASTFITTFAAITNEKPGGNTNS